MTPNTDLNDIPVHFTVQMNNPEKENQQCDPKDETLEGVVV